MIKIYNHNIKNIAKNYTNNVSDRLIEELFKAQTMCDLLLGATSIKDKDIDGIFHTHKLVFKYLGWKEVFYRKINLFPFLEGKRISLTTTERQKIINFKIIITHLDKLSLTNLLLTKPKKLHKKLWTDFNTRIAEPNREFIVELFNYKKYYSIIDKAAQELNLNTCPYCNRNYITSLLDSKCKKIIGSSIDHFYNQKENALLSLCFYNLIPSCTICNSNLKSSKNFHIDYNLHPYINGMKHKHASFDFDLTLNTAQSKTRFKPSLNLKVLPGSKAYKRLKQTTGKDDSGNLDVFRIEEIFESHFDTVEEIHQKFDEHSKYYIKSILDLVKDLNTSDNEFYRFYFGNYYFKDEFHKRPLSKLTKDIYRKMKNIALTDK